MVHLDTMLYDIVRAIFGGGMAIGGFTPARVAQYVDAKVPLADITATLSQVALVLCVVFSCIIVYIIIKRRELASTATQVLQEPDAAGQPATQAVPGALRPRWNEVVAHLDSTHENDWKAAVMEADKLADSALAQAGFSGDTFADRLSNMPPGTLLSIDGLWWAHRIRNRVAHEMDYFLRYTEARQAVSYYEAALNELQLI